jgi:hypothetical protein
VLVALALVGLLSVLTVLNFNRSGLNLADATETLAGNIRLAAPMP